MEDEELLRLAKNGDEQAENEILHKYKDIVVKIARSYFIIGGEMEDIIQEGMIGLYKAIKNFDSTKQVTFKTFAVMCIKHQIQSAIKRANTKKNNPLSTSISLQDLSDKNGEKDVPIELILQISPDEEFIDKENYKSLLLSIKDALSKKEYDVLKLYLQGYTYKEIAQFLNLNTKSIDNSLSRIKNKIKEMNVA